MSCLRVCLHILFVLELFVCGFATDCQQFHRNSYEAKAHKFCESHEHCFQLGKRDGDLGFMVGQCMHKIVREHLGTHWINVNALMQQKGDMNASYWAFGELGAVGQPLISKWGYTWDNRARSQVHDRALVLTANGQFLRTQTKNKRFTFVCHMKKIRKSRGVINREKFWFKQGSSEKAWIAPNDNTQGCFSSHDDMTTMQCALR